MANARECDICQTLYKHDPELLSVLVERGSKRPDTLAKIEVFHSGGFEGHIYSLDVDKNCMKRAVRAFMNKLDIKELPETVLDGRYYVQDEADGCDHIILDSVVTGDHRVSDLFSPFKGKNIRIFVEVL